MRKKSLIENVLKVAVVSLMIAFPLMMMAQPGPGPGGGGPPPVPVDGGLLILLSAGAALGIKKLKSNSEK